jgi:hypothetical protein
MHLWIQCMVIRVSRDQSSFDSSPELIAVFHALHRLLAPRHPPHALSSLTALIPPSIGHSGGFTPTGSPDKDQDCIPLLLSKSNDPISQSIRAHAETQKKLTADSSRHRQSRSCDCNSYLNRIVKEPIIPATGQELPHVLERGTARARKTIRVPNRFGITKVF